jgi:hypothetical protein
MFYCDVINFQTLNLISNKHETWKYLYKNETHVHYCIYTFMHLSISWSIISNYVSFIH